MFDFLKKNKEIEVDDSNVIKAPLEGKVITMKEVNDPIFAEELLGKGVAIQPIKGRVVAPANAEVTTIADTKHAIGLTLASGVELLIHVGLDTVKLNGEYFTPCVKIGDKVKVGTVLMEFNLEQLKKKGFDTTTPIIISNTADYSEIRPILGKVRELDKIIELSR